MGMPWFKVWNDTVHDLKIHQIAYEMDKEFTSILGAWIVVLSIANESPERGKLLLSRDTCVTSPVLSRSLNWEVEETKQFIDLLIHLDMLEDVDESVYIVKNWEKRQAISDSNAAERKRRQREREKSPLPSDVTDVTRDMSRSMSRDASESISESISISSSSLTDDSFSKMRDLLERLTGLMMSPADVPLVNEFVAKSVTEADIRGALQWRKDNNRPAVKTISQLAGGIETNRTMRIQGASAKGSNNGHKDYTAGLPEQEPVDIEIPILEKPLSLMEQKLMELKLQLKSTMPRAEYEKYVMPLVDVEVEDGTVIVGCADPSHEEWLKSRLSGMFNRYWSGALNHKAEARFVSNRTLACP